MARGPGKEHRTNKPPPTGRVWERSKGDTTCLTTSQNSSLLHPSWLSDACTTRKDSELEWLAKDHPETNPITIKQETAHQQLQSCSSVLPYRTILHLVPFPIKFLALSAHVSLDNSFPSVRQEPSLGPWKGSPFPATASSFWLNYGFLNRRNPTWCVSICVYNIIKARFKIQHKTRIKHSYIARKHE